MRNKVEWVEYSVGYWTMGNKIDISFIVPGDYIATEYQDENYVGDLQDRYSYFYFKSKYDNSFHFGYLSEKETISKKEAKSIMDRGQKYVRKEWKQYEVFHTVLDERDPCTIVEEQDGMTIHGTDLINKDIIIYEAIFHEIKK